MPLHQKIGLVLIMALGLLAMVMSIMRIIWIVSFYRNDETTLFTLALLEGPMVIIMGCIPTLRSLMDPTFSAGSSLRRLFSKCRFSTEQQLETPRVEQSSAITGAYLDLELTTRKPGVLNQSRNVRVCTTDLHSRNRSEDYLVDQIQLRKTENFSYTDGPTLDV